MAKTSNRTSGNPAVRDYWGGLRKRGHGGTVNPPRNRKSEDGNPPPTAGAPELYPNQFCRAHLGPKSAHKRSFHEHAVHGHLPAEQVLKRLPPIGFRFVAIAVVGGTGERRGPVFENRDIRAITLAHQPQMMTLGRWTRAQGRLSKNI